MNEEVIKDIIKEAEKKMEKSVEFVKKELMRIRAGEGNPGMLEGIKVEAYDTVLPLNQVASIVCPEPRLIVIKPWDKTILPNIKKAIMKSDLGITPVEDGNALKLPIPPLTDERRKELIKMVKKIVEEGKVSIRNIRRDAIEKIKELEHVSEDDIKRGEKEVQKKTDEYIEKLDELFEKKAKEIES